jgi:hypothetical protein
MKVRQLLEKLKTMNPNSFVVMEGEENDLEVEEVEEDYRKQEVKLIRKK